MQETEKIQDMMERIQMENDYENDRLEGRDLLGEHVNIYLEFDGCFWTVKFGVCSSDTAFFCWVEDDKLQYDNTYWCDYETPEEALKALDEQCKQMKKRKVLLVSDEQLYGDGYAVDDEDDKEDNP